MAKVFNARKEERVFTCNTVVDLNGWGYGDHR
jgi:hypothetical protein